VAGSPQDPDGEVAQAGHGPGGVADADRGGSSAKVTSDRAVADDRKTWPLHDRLDGQVVAPRSGQVLQRHSERIAEANNRAERGGRQSTGLDLAQRLRRDASRLCHVAEVTICSGMAQERPESLASLELLGGEGMANHAAMVRLVFQYRQG
jgi:hypothetical protein